MKTLDLKRAIPRSIMALEDRGEPISVKSVLNTLGIDLPPTLHPNDPEYVLAAPAAPSGSDAGSLPPLGRFQPVGELGQGGMGRVLEARDPELRRSVAVKVVVDAGNVTEALLTRFVAEAQITSQLEHPNIVPVHDIGLSRDGQVYFVMKKVQGRSLRAVLDALLDGDEATSAVWGRHRLLTAFVQICNAVAYAHDRGVLHRDIKPGNVMLGPFGEVLLMDWGVARLLGDTTEAISANAVERVTVAKTMDGAAIGTPGYMAPEQALGQLHELDCRADVWSLGAILYEILTLRRAYEGPNVFALMHLAMSGPPEDPRVRAPGRSIPEEIAEVALKALAGRRGDRFATATELAAAVEAFLKGSKRREAALRYVAEAQAAWARYGAVAQERDELQAREKELEEVVEPWAPLEDKAELLGVRQRLSGLGRARVDRFEQVVFACEQALSQAPGNPEACALLATVHYARFEEAEATRDEDEQHHHEQRVRRYDDVGRYAPLLEGAGSLSLRTEPAGAHVVAERYDCTGPLAWPKTDRRDLGTAPLERVPLEQGSYLLTIRSPGKRDTRYPVFIPRSRHWDSGDAPMPLYADVEIGADCAYVPPGPFVCGGDAGAHDPLPRSERWEDGFFVQVLPVSMQQYCDFINALAEVDPDEAWARTPRRESGLKTSGGQYWPRPGPGEPYSVPNVDRDGDAWNPNWAVMAISWNDAQAYCAWRSDRDGVTWSLPSEQQWEKAARGVDGRVFPWGSGFDPTLCKMRLSRPGRPQPAPAGAFETDSSPFGVRDLAGSMREWCGDETHGGDATLRPVRGGSWDSRARYCRGASRVGYNPWNVISNVGFRLARAAAARGA